MTDKLILQYSKSGRYGNHLDVRLYEDEHGAQYEEITNQDGESWVEEVE